MFETIDFYNYIEIIYVRYLIETRERITPLICVMSTIRKMMSNCKTVCWLSSYIMDINSQFIANFPPKIKIN